MTVTAQVPSNRYAYAGSSNFVYSFLILNSADLLVQVDGITKALGIDYTVSGVGASGGGSITYLGALTTGQIVTLSRSTTLARAVDYQHNGDLKAVDLNADLDRLWMAVQEVDRDAALRGLKVPLGETVNDLPTSTARTDSFLRFDSSGQPAAYRGDPTSSAALAADLASISAGKGASLVGVQDAGGWFDGVNGEAVLQELANPAGKFNAGVNALRYIPPAEWPNIIARTPSIDISTWVNPGISSNSELYFPPGKYIISTIVPVYGSKIRGAGKYANTGTEFISTTNAPMISFGGSPVGGSNVSFVEIRGIRFTGLKTAGTSQHCVQVYPQQSFITFRDCHIVAMGGNGLHFTGTLTGAGNDQWTVKDCKIEQCLGYGVYCDTQLATSIFEQIEVYANNAGGWYLTFAAGKIDNLYFLRCHTRDNGNTTGPAHGWDIGPGVQDCYWQSCWCEDNGERAGLTDPTHRTAGWYIHTGAASTLTFESCRNSVHARGFWITGNTTGVRIIDPSFLNLTGWRTSVDILVDAGSSAYIEDPISNGDLVIAITDNRSVVKYNGIAPPVGTNSRIARGSQYSFNDGSTVRYLVGGSVTYGLYGATCACTAGSPVITASGGHSMRIGDRVLIPGAGTAGAILQAYIIDMSVANLNITLDRNVITTVAAASVITGNPFPSTGTFTPVISGATTAGAGTYTSQTGSYQIDEYGYCTVNLSAAWTAHTGAGTCLVSLPIACAESAVGSIWPTNYTYGAGNSPMILATAGQSYCQLRTFADGAAGAALAIDAAASLSATVRFKVTLPV